MKKSNCFPTILDNDTLMSDGVFMNKELVSEECKCIYSDTCKAIIDLLNHKKLEEAEVLLFTIK